MQSSLFLHKYQERSAILPFQFYPFRINALTFLGSIGVVAVTGKNGGCLFFCCSQA